MSNHASARPRRVADVMRPFEGRERVGLAELLGPLGIEATERHRLIAQGLVTPLPPRGPHGGYQIGAEEARFVARAALTAVAAGTAVSVAMRVLSAGEGVSD